MLEGKICHFLISIDKEIKKAVRNIKNSKNVKNWEIKKWMRIDKQLYDGTIFWRMKCYHSEVLCSNFSAFSQNMKFLWRDSPWSLLVRWFWNQRNSFETIQWKLRKRPKKMCNLSYLTLEEGVYFFLIHNFLDLSSFISAPKWDPKLGWEMLERVGRIQYGRHIQVCPIPSHRIYLLKRNRCDHSRDTKLMVLLAVYPKHF